MNLDHETTSAVLELTQRFGRDELEPAFERPEQRVSPEAFSELLQKATDLGLLGDEELGIWCSPDDPASLQLSVQVLIRLATHNGGFAFAVHQRALAETLVRALNQTTEGAVLHLSGKRGLAREALARWLTGQQLDPHQIAQLCDHFPGPDGSLLQTSADWQMLLIPGLDSELQTNWSLFSRDELQVQPKAQQHGLDELPLFHIATTGQSRRVDGTSDATALYLRALTLNALGILAVSLGTARRGYRLAREYAETRKQGGSLIIHHSAVQLLLGKSLSTLTTVDELLKSVSPPNDTPAALTRILRFRSVCGPLLYDCVTDCLQVFGGMGYMQDTGLEKILRDINQLNLSYGTPTDLNLFATSAEVAR